MKAFTMRNGSRTSSAGRLVKAFLGIILALCLIASGPMPAVHASGLPTMPHQFYGTVTLDGEPVPEGTLVEVLAGGVKQADTTIDSEGRYGYEPLLRIPSEPPGEVTFRVGGVTANESSTLTQGTIEELNLTVSSDLNPHFVPDKDAVKVGDVVTFTNLTTGGTLPYTRAEWDFGDDTPPLVLEGTHDEVMAAVTHAYATAGSYYVTLSMTDSFPVTRSESRMDPIVVSGAGIVGTVWEIDCARPPLEGVTVTLYNGDGLPLASDMSDENGEYVLGVPAFGDYQVVASKAGFREETQAITVTEATIYTLDFIGDHGLIPNRPDVFYVLDCIYLWKHGEPPCDMDVFSVLDVIYAWKNQITAATRTGAWADEVIITQEPDAWQAVTELGSGELDVYAGNLRDAALFDIVEDDPDLWYKSSIGSFNTLRLNPYGPLFDDGSLNPFHYPEMQAAFNKCIDRTFIAMDIEGGLAWERFTAFHPQLPDYARFLDDTYVLPESSIQYLEDKYDFDEAEGWTLVQAAIDAINADLAPDEVTWDDDLGRWIWDDDVIEMTIAIRSDDPVREEIGDYVVTQLRKMGFEASGFKGDMAATLSGLVNVEAEITGGGWSIYTGGWISTILLRDEAYWFMYFHTNVWADGIPAFAYLEVPEELWDAAYDLLNMNFSTIVYSTILV